MYKLSSHEVFSMKPKWLFQISKADKLSSISIFHTKEMKIIHIKSARYEDEKMLVYAPRSSRTMFSAPIAMDINTMLPAIANVIIHIFMFHFKTLVPSRL